MQDRIAQVFFEQFGCAPHALVRAPGRINLIGEHTDYNGGLVLPGAIDKAIYLAIGPRQDERFAFYAADLGEKYVSNDLETAFQDKLTWANYLLGVISEISKDGHRVKGMNVAFCGNIPLGAGLSSSAAVECAMIMGMDNCFAYRFSKMDMVRLAQRGENNFVGMNCGIMDMFASVMGKAGHLIRLDCQSLDFQHVPFNTEEFSLILLDSGIQHALVDSAYNERRAQCETGIKILQQFSPHITALRDVSPMFLAVHKPHMPDLVYRRCSYVVSEIQRVEMACAALQQGDFWQLGQLMFQTHEGLSHGYEVSTPEMDFLVENARRCGATGSRMMGGGFGGCTLNLLHSNLLSNFIEKQSTAYHQAFGLPLKSYHVRLSDGVA